MRVMFVIWSCHESNQSVMKSRSNEKLNLGICMVFICGPLVPASQAPSSGIIITKLRRWHWVVMSCESVRSQDVASVIDEKDPVIIPSIPLIFSHNSNKPHYPRSHTCYEGSIGTSQFPQIISSSSSSIFETKLNETWKSKGWRPVLKIIISPCLQPDGTCVGKQVSDAT